jgi:glucosyl-dolichyl phosphate glucuronosyltransferase
MISVIIPTRNRANLLNSALKSIVNQKISSSKFEVLVINNGSNDNTSRIINNYKKALFNLEEIYVHKPGLHNGRHAGMKKAKGNILVFTDDDIEALPTWLSTIDIEFKDPEVAMVGGNNFPLFLNKPPDWLNRMWNRKNFKGYKSIPSLSIIEFNCSKNLFSPYLVWGCNFSIRKDVLLKAGGFHPDSMPDKLIHFRGDGETHVSKYIDDHGLKCVFNSKASVYHKVTPERMTIDYFYKRSFNQGISDSYTKLRSNLKLSDHRFDVLILVKKILASLKNIINKNLVSSTEKKIIKAQIKGYKEGFRFHQTFYHNNIELRDWVHKDNYM